WGVWGEYPPHNQPSRTDSPIAAEGASRADREAGRPRPRQSARPEQPWGVWGEYPPHNQPSHNDGRWTPTPARFGSSTPTGSSSPSAAPTSRSCPNGGHGAASSALSPTQVWPARRYTS